MRDERSREQLSILCLPAGTTETGNIEVDGATERIGERQSDGDRRGNRMTAGGRVTANQRGETQREKSEKEIDACPPCGRGGRGGRTLEIEREKPLDGTESGHAVSVSRHSPASSFSGSIPVHRPPLLQFLAPLSLSLSFSLSRTQR